MIDDTHKVVQVLVLPPDGNGRHEPAVAAHDRMFNLVGGWLEVLNLPTEPASHLYCNEDGKVRDLPINMPATALATFLGWHPRAGDVLRGTVVFLGNGGGHSGEEADVPAVVVEAYDKLSRDGWVGMQQL